MEKLIKLNNVTKKYKLGSQDIIALNNINLTVYKGDFLAITGASGSGKSTLMNILGFLDTPDSGEYYFEGISSSKYSSGGLSKIRGEKIGFIFQNFYLLPELNAYQNVEIPLIYNRINKTLRKKLCENSLKKVGLTDRMFHTPNKLSGGQKQRVAIARAISLSPPLILADEPTGNLDPDSAKDVLNILKTLNAEGTTVIMITHDKELADMAKRKIEIQNGNIVSEL